jgi:hypothetical protein
MTIYEKYYAMNKAINDFLVNNGYPCEVFKYGSVPEGISYPYIQTTFRVTYRQPYGTSQSGTLTGFEYYLNFFTAARTDRENDAALFIPFEAVREAIVSPYNPIWRGIANMYGHTETPEFNFKGGLEVLQKGLIFECQAVTTHIVIDEYTIAPTEEAISAVQSGLNIE